MPVWKKVSLGIIGFLVILAGFTAFVLPGIVRTQAIKRIEAATGRKITVGKVSINPFTGGVAVGPVRLTERGRDEVFVSFSSARAVVSPASVFRRGLVVSEFRLASPHVSLERLSANTYNFSDLLEKKKTAPEPHPEKSEPFRFSINNISIVNGSLDFRDRALSSPKHHTVRRFNLRLPFVSTMPYLAGRYITPHLDAVVNGAPLALEGKLKVIPTIAEASLSVNLKQLDLPFYQAYIPGRQPVTISSGKGSVGAEVVYRVTEKDKPELLLSGTLQLNDLALKDPAGAPLFALRTGVMNLSLARLFARSFDLASLTLDGPELYVSRDSRGVWSQSRLAGEKKPEEKKEQPPVIRLAVAKLSGGVIHFSDRLPRGGFAATLHDLALSLKGLSTAPGEKGAPFSLSAVSGRDERLDISGEIRPEPLDFRADVTAKGIPLEAYYPYLATTLTAPVKGKLDLSGRLGFDREAGLVVDQGAAKLSSLQVPFAGKDGVRLAELLLQGGMLRLKERKLAIDSISLNNGDVRLSREEDGSFSFRKLLAAKGKEKNETSPKKTKGEEPPFSYLLKSVAGKGLAIAFTDKSRVGNPRFDLRRMSFSLAPVSGPAPAPIPFRVAAVWGKGGAVSASGRLTPEPLAVQGKYSLKRIPLTDFDAYLPDNLNIILADGLVDSAGSLSLSRKGGDLQGNFSGNLGVRSFYCLDEDADDLLKWESLQIDRLGGTIAPFKLAVEDVALNGFYSKIVVNPDGTLNLQHLVTEKEGAPAAATSPPPAAAPAPPATAAKAAPAAGRTITINTITLQDGVLSFTDRHLKQVYAATFHNLGGRISGLSSAENQFADVDLRGNLENHSPLQITGKINPLRDDLFIDLKVSFNDIDLSPFTPYSATYLGYSVDKGKLFLDLKYLIEKKKLSSDNKLFLDQFTFGKKVESDKATALPVRLAVALLKDRKGEIHLDLPVTGRTDDPEFSAWRVVLQMLKNLLVKAATSPFALLQSAFGGGTDFSAVTFDYGSARLNEGEKEKLRKLATALKDRPSLKISVTGFVARDLDAEGYRNELLMKKIRTEKFLDLVKEKKNQPGDSPETMKLIPEEYSRYLLRVYRKEKFPKPRTFIGTLKSLPDEEMKKLILANTVVGAEQLKALAEERVAAVKDFLAGEGKLDPARLFQKSGDIYKAPDKKEERQSRVEFGAAVE